MSKLIKLTGHEYIAKTRQYLDYLEEHFNNIEKAFELVCDRFKDSYLIYDEYHFFNLKDDVKDHDLSKFSQHEFTQYRAKFYPTKHEIDNRPNFVEGVEPVYQSDIDFEQAWKHHEKNNNHHASYIKTLLTETKNNSNELFYCIIHLAIDLIAMSFKFNDNPHHYYLKNIKDFDLEKIHHDLLVDVFEKCGFGKD